MSKRTRYTYGELLLGTTAAIIILALTGLIFFRIISL
jgi:hypothetical protein